MRRVTYDIQGVGEASLESLQIGREDDKRKAYMSFSITKQEDALNFFIGGEYVMLALQVIEHESADAILITKEYCDNEKGYEYVPVVLPVTRDLLEDVLCGAGTIAKKMLPEFANGIFLS